MNKGRYLNIDTSINIADAVEGIKKLQTELDKSEKKQRQALSMEKSLKAREEKLRAYLKKTVDDESLSEKKKEKIREKTIRQIEKLYEDHYNNLTDLANKSFEKTKESAKQAGKSIVESLARGEGLGIRRATETLFGAGGIGGGKFLGGIGIAIDLFTRFKNKALEAAEAFKPIQSNIVDFQKRINDLSDTTFQNLLSRFKDLADSIPVTTETVSKVASQFSSLTIQSENLDKAITRAIQLAQEDLGRLDVSGEEVETFSKGVERLLQTTNRDFSQLDKNLGLVRTIAMQTGEPVIEVLTEISTATSKANAAIEDNAEAFKAAALHMAITKQSGVELGEATTQVEELFLRFVTDVDLLNNAFKKYDVAADTSIESTEDYINVMDALREKYDEMQKKGGATFIQFRQDMEAAFGGTAFEGLNFIFEQGERFRSFAEDFLAAEEYAGFTETLRRTAAGMEQEIDIRIKNIMSSAGQTITQLQQSFNTILLSIFETSEQRANAALRRLDIIRERAESVGDILAKSMQLELDWDPSQANALFDALRNNMDQLAQDSPVIAKNIQEIIDSAEGATPTALAQVREQLALIKQDLDMRAEAEGMTVLSETFSNFAFQAGENIAYMAEQTESSFSLATTAMAVGFQRNFDEGFFQGIGQSFSDLFRAIGGQSDQVAEEARADLAAAFTINVTGIEGMEERLKQMRKEITHWKTELQDTIENMAEGENKAARIAEITQRINILEPKFIATQKGLEIAEKQLEKAAENMIHVLKNEEDLEGAVKRELIVRQESGELIPKAAENLWKVLEPQIQIEMAARAQAEIQKEINALLEKTPAQQISDQIREQNKEIEIQRSQLQEINGAIQSGEALGINISHLYQQQKELTQSIAEGEQRINELRSNKALAEQITDQENLNNLVEQQRVKLDLIAIQIQTAVKTGADYKSLLEDESKIMGIQQGLMLKIYEIQKKEKDEQQRIVDLAKSHKLSLDSLVKVHDTNLLKERAILLAKKQTLLAIREEIKTKLESVLATNNDIDAQNLMRKAVQNVNTEIENGNKLLAARAKGDYSFKITTTTEDISGLSREEIASQLEIMLGAIDKQIEEIDTGLKGVNDGLGITTKSADEARQAFARITDEAKKLRGETEDIEFQTSIMDLEGTEQEMAVLEHEWEKTLANLTEAQRHNQEYMLALWENHEAKVSQINRKRQKEEAEAEKQRLEEQKKKQEEAEKLAEEEAQKARERLKAAAEAHKRYLNETRKREQAYTQFFIDLQKERISQVSAIEKRSGIFQTYHQQLQTMNEDLRQLWEAAQEGDDNAQALYSQQRERYKRQLDALRSDLKTTYYELGTDPLRTTEQLITRQWRRAIQSYNQMLSLLDETSAKLEDVNPNKIFGKVPIDVWMEYNNLVLNQADTLKILEDQYKEIDLILSKMTENDTKRNIVQDYLVKNAMKQLDMMQEQYELNAQRFYLANESMGLERELLKIEYEINLERIKALGLIQDSTESRKELLRYEQRNLQILEEIVKPYKELNAQAEEFLKARQETMEEELSESQKITSEYKKQLDQLNQNIYELKNREGLHGKTAETLKETLDIMIKQSEEQRNLMNAKKEEIELSENEKLTRRALLNSESEALRLKRESISELQNRLNQATNDLRYLPFTIETIAGNIRENYSRIDGYEKNLAKAREDNDKARIESLEKSIDYRYKEIEEAEYLKEELEDELKTLKERIPVWKDELTAMKDEEVILASNSEKAKESLNMQEERIKQLEKANRIEQESLNEIEYRIKKTEEDIKLAEKKEEFTEAERKELERMIELRNKLALLRLKEQKLALEAAKQSFAEFQKEIELMGSPFLAGEQEIKDRFDLMKKEAAEYRDTIMEGIATTATEEESEEAQRQAAIEYAETLEKIEKMEIDEVQKYRDEKLLESVNKFTSWMQTSINVVVDLFEQIGDMFSEEAWSSTEAVLGTVSGLSNSIAGVANQFGPVGETIGGAFSMIGGIIDAIAKAIPDEISKEEMLSFELDKQRKILDAQFSTMDKLMELGIEGYDTARERTAEYKRQLALMISLFETQHKINLDETDSIKTLDEIEDAKNRIAGYEKRIEVHKAKGTSNDEDEAVRLQGKIDKENELIGQLEEIFELQQKINDSLKEQGQELLRQVDLLNQLTRGEEISLQMQNYILQYMLKQTDASGELLYSGEERLELLIQQQDVLRQIKDLELEIEASILRQKGLTDDSLAALAQQLSNLQKISLDMQTSAQSAFAEISQIFSPDQLAEVFGLVTEMEKGGFSYIAFLNRMGEILDEAGHLAEYQGEANLTKFNKLVETIKTAATFSAAEYNQFLEEEDKLTRSIIDTYFEKQLATLQHQLNMGEITQKQFTEQSAILVDSWTKIYQGNEDEFNKVATIIKDNISDLIADLPQELQDVIKAYDLDLGNLIVTDKDIWDLLERGKKLAESFINGIFQGLSEISLIQYKLDELKHMFEMGEITEAEYDKQRVELLEQQLKLLDAQRELLDDGTGLTLELWNLDKERWSIQEEIHDIINKQNGLLKDQERTEDSLLSSLFKRRNAMKELLRDQKGVDTAQYRQGLENIEDQIIQRMKELGIDPSIIAQTLQAFAIQNRFHEGGRVERDQLAFVQKGEEILTKRTARSLEQEYPGFIEQLRGDRLPSDVRHIIESYSRNTSHMDNRSMNLNQYFGENQLTFQINGAQQPQVVGRQIVQMTNKQFWEQMKAAQKEFGGKSISW